MEPNIDELLIHLDQLRIREDNIRIEITSVIGHIKALRQKETQEEGRPQTEERVQNQVRTQRSSDRDFEPRDRILVLNKTKPGQGKTGTVTKVQGPRVNYIAEDGTPTWRLKKNLKLLL